MKTLYTAKVQVKNGRDGSLLSDDGFLNARLAFPLALGGDGQGTNPEQLFGAGYAACFGSTLTAVARASGTTLTAVVVDAEVDIMSDAGAFALGVRLAVRATGADLAALTRFVAQAEQACPYANATRNNVVTTVRIVSAA